MLLRTIQKKKIAGEKAGSNDMQKTKEEFWFLMDSSFKFCTKAKLTELTTLVSREISLRGEEKPNNNRLRPKWWHTVLPQNSFVKGRWAFKMSPTRANDKIIAHL